MKRAGIIGICLFLALSPAAHAFDTVNAAYSAMREAGAGLQAQAEDALRGESPAMAEALIGFSKVAAEARDTMDALDGPGDLRCIFNGMSDDALARARDLAEAADAAAKQAALEEIQLLGRDAIEVTPEAEENDADPLAGLPPVTCEASFEPINAADLAALAG